LEKLDQDYWETSYQQGNTGWDIGEISTPLKAYIDQLTDKSLSILIPGAGFGHEAGYLHQKGFSNVVVLDLSQLALEKFKSRYPNFNSQNLVQADFFDHTGSYDLILEQTFFCAITPDLRKQYVHKVHELLKPGGKLVGLLWRVPMNDTHPPFGGSEAEYQQLFSPKFEIDIIDLAYNSIKPRSGTELFVKMRKRALADIF